MPATPNEFWLRLHELTEAYELEGGTPAERLESIGHQFSKMPAAVREQLLAKLEVLIETLPKVVSLITATTDGQSASS